MTPPRDAGGHTDDRAQPAAPPEETWELRLYVTGHSPKSIRVLANLHHLAAEPGLQASGLNESQARSGSLIQRRNATTVHR